MRMKSLGKFRWSTLLVLACSAAAPLLYAVVADRIAYRRTRSAENLKRIGIASRTYLDRHDKMPATIRSGEGTPLLSWRVAILPFLQEQGLHGEFHLDEPWDSPHNKTLLDRMPAVFALPGSPAVPGETFYRSFSGPHTMYDPADADGAGRVTFTDGAESTLAVVEARRAVPWTCPENEIPIDGEGERASDILRGQLGGHFPGGFHALFVDGRVKFLPETINARTLKSLITRNGRDIIVHDDTSLGTRAETDFDTNRSLFAPIAAADRLLLYEGLPHQRYEWDLLEDELRTKATVTLQGFPFYRQPLEVSDADRDALKAVLGDERSFRQWPGEKPCDGFHPDYLAEWRVDGASYQILICFGCGEVKAIGPGRSLRCDIERSKQQELGELLKKYRKNRPGRE